MGRSYAGAGTDHQRCVFLATDCPTARPHSAHVGSKSKADIMKRSRHFRSGPYNGRWIAHRQASAPVFAPRKKVKGPHFESL